MKHLRFLSLAAILYVCAALPLQAVAYDNVVIAFLKQKPSHNSVDCTPEDLMELLTPESLEWVESVDCQYIRIDKDRAGVRLNVNAGDNHGAYVRINFKPNRLMKIVRVRAYGVSLDTEDTRVEIDCNGTPYVSGNLSIDGKVFNSECDPILTNMVKNSGVVSVPAFTNPVNIAPLLPLRSVTFAVPEQKGNNCVQFYGFKIFYDGLQENSETSVIESDVSVENDHGSHEYYDISGRRLQTPPSRGIYLSKCGAKVEKRVAR